MKKITDNTEFDYYYSKTADKLFGHKIVKGSKYTERVRSERGRPVNEYEDLVLVLEKHQPFKDL
jgi:hypothetical protein